MEKGTAAIPRPKRWDIPFSQEREGDRLVTDDDVNRLLGISPFCDLDIAGFKRSLPLRGILKNDTRFLDCETGDIIVREGDWGNSAFFILSGSVRVELVSSASSLSPSILGRGESRKKSFFEVLSQLWSNHKEPEFRSTTTRSSSKTLSRGAGENTRIYLEDVSAVLSEIQTATIEAGQWFGEIAALGRSPRVATVFTDSPSEILEIRWQGLRDIMRNDRDGSLKNYIEEVFRSRALASFLRNLPIFRHVSEEDMSELVARAEFESFGNYDSAKPFSGSNKKDSRDLVELEPIVAREGDHNDSVILVRSGLARIARRHYNGHRTLSYLMPGRAFGVPEALQSWETKSSVPLSSSLSAIGYLNVVKIPVTLIERFVFQQRPTKKLLSSEADEDFKKFTPKEIDGDLMDFLVDRRFVQGTATMIIDMDRCTRCDDCVRACATAHDNNPRFIRQGPTHSHFMIATSCMHCIDPVCMIECPTGAIHRNLEHGEVEINDPTCIGCMRCANNCPYNAISMAEIRDTNGNFYVDEQSRPLMKATKCDLCLEQWGGPACQRACPHDALTRVDMRDMIGLGEVLNR